MVNKKTFPIYLAKREFKRETITTHTFRILPGQNPKIPIFQELFQNNKKIYIWTIRTFPGLRELSGHLDDLTKTENQVSMKLRSEYLKLVPAIVYAGGSASQMLILFWLSET